MHDNFVLSLGLPLDHAKVMSAKPVDETPILTWWKAIFGVKRLPMWLQFMKENSMCEDDLLEGIKTSNALIKVLVNQVLDDTFCRLDGLTD
eukprot:5578675-Karenia_brevis.AAC.1